MKKLIFSLAILFCMTFALTVDFTDKSSVSVEQVKMFSISSNFP